MSWIAIQTLASNDPPWLVPIMLPENPVNLYEDRELTLWDTDHHLQGIETGGNPVANLQFRVWGEHNKPPFADVDQLVRLQTDTLYDLYVSSLVPVASRVYPRHRGWMSAEWLEHLYNQGRLQLCYDLLAGWQTPHNVPDPQTLAVWHQWYFIGDMPVRWQGQSGRIGMADLHIVRHRPLVEEEALRDF